MGCNITHVVNFEMFELYMTKARADEISWEIWSLKWNKMNFQHIANASLPRLNIRYDILSENFVKCRSCETDIVNYPIVSNFGISKWRDAREISERSN